MIESLIFAPSTIKTNPHYEKNPCSFFNFLFHFQVQQVIGQEKLKEGKITFEITLNNAEEMNDQMLAMMPKKWWFILKTGEAVEKWT